ncbi:hypothetical protein QKG08_14995 [Clavibacter michiganensis]|uniref:hypothetical protein n=1 Tax=Clavibacter michiganensis TaxID=28447 RepID=UPI0026DBADAB|nr:hypothetical protein [Clavibacter michiganensis]MDO4070359.1 hypothetical protein [Clavibacter michiganensis]
MAETKQINFTESQDGQWIVKCITESGEVYDGKSFMAQDIPNWSKLEQVTYQLRAMGFRPLSRSNDNANESHYSFKVALLTPTS